MNKIQSLLKKLSKLQLSRKRNKGIFYVLRKGLAALPDYITFNVPNIVKVLPNIEGPRSEAHFVYPQSLKNVARVVAFRNFLYSKIRQWEF